MRGIFMVATEPEAQNRQCPFCSLTQEAERNGMMSLLDLSNDLKI